MDSVSIADYFIRWVPVVIGNAYLATKSLQYTTSSPFSTAFRYIGILATLCGIGISLWILSALTTNQTIFTLGLTLGTIIIHIGLSLFWLLIWRIGFQHRINKLMVFSTITITNIFAALIYAVDSYSNVPPEISGTEITKNGWLVADITFSLGFIGMLITGVVFLRAAAVNPKLQRKVAALSHALWTLTLSTFFILNPYVSRSNFSDIFYIFMAAFFITSLLLIYGMQRKAKKQ